MNVLASKRALGALLIGTTCAAHMARAPSALAQVHSVRASAETTPRARARELGDRGLAAYDAGDYGRALELFREALELYDFPTLRLYVARSLSKEGTPVAASREYEALLARPIQADEGEAGIEARAAAHAELREAQARRPRLTLVVAGGDVAGVRVELSGPSRPEVVLGREIFVEPGTYELRAVHPDGRRSERSILLSEGRAERIELAWSEPAMAPAVAMPAAAPGAAEPSPPAHTDATNTPAWVLGVISAVLLGGTVITGAVAAARKSDYDDANDRSDVSDGEKRELRESAFDMQVVNTAFAAGMVLGASATLYFIVRQPSAEDGAGPTAASASTPSGWQLGVRGEF
jgi:tetratricopeptide (TPR) repeat protein